MSTYMEPLDGAVLVVTANHFTIADLKTNVNKAQNKTMLDFYTVQYTVEEI